MIEAYELTRRYGEFTAVGGVSFSVDEGEIVGILGPNGAGKTTIIRMITGFLPPTGGRVTVAGHDLARDPLVARQELGYLPENVALYPEMRVREYLGYRAYLEGVPRATARTVIGEVMERCLIDDVSGQIIGTLSKGYRQRVGLATAILHNPRVLVLDEPTVGLDPKQIVAIRELIRELGEKHTLLLSTHILPEVELLCDRVVIIDQGRIVAEGSPSDLQQQWVGNPVVRVEVKQDGGAVAGALATLEGVAEVRRHAGGANVFLVEAESGCDLREDIFALAVESGWILRELTEERASLEDVFVRLTTRDAAADAGGESIVEVAASEGAVAEEPLGQRHRGEEEVPS